MSFLKIASMAIIFPYQVIDEPFTSVVLSPVGDETSQSGPGQVIGYTCCRRHAQGRRWGGAGGDTATRPSPNDSLQTKADSP